MATDLQTIQWCVGGPMHGAQAPGTAYGEFTLRNAAGEEANYRPMIATVDGLKREFFLVSPYDLDGAEEAIRKFDQTLR